MKANQHVELLNQNIPVEVDDLDQDHMTYLIIYNKAHDTDAKFASIEARKNALISSGQIKANPDEKQNQALMNMASSQLLTNAYSQQKNADI